MMPNAGSGAMLRHLMPYVLRYLLRYVLLGGVSLLCIFPFWWTLVTALSTRGNLFTFPPSFWPQGVSLENFAEVWQVIPMLRFFGNSLAITLSTVLWRLVVCALAAYPLARMAFRGRQLILAIIVATMVLPSEVNFLVNFMTVTHLGLIDTYTGEIGRAHV